LLQARQWVYNASRWLAYSENFYLDQCQELSPGSIATATGRCVALCEIAKLTESIAV